MESTVLNISKECYNIAELKISMTTYYDKTKRQAEDYISKEKWDEDQADEIINFGQEFYEKMKKKNYPYVPYDTIEYMYTGSLFARLLLRHNGCMLHSSAVVVDGYAYLFSADSGTGKSTHTQLWKKYFGERAFIINDDKPVLRYIDGEWYVYGTPWSGKTDQNVNAKVKLGAVVFLERSEKNWIDTISIKDAIPKFFNQTVRKLNQEANMELVLKYMELILTTSPIYKMGCNISEDAVIMAYEKIRRV